MIEAASGHPLCLLPVVIKNWEDTSHEALLVVIKDWEDTSRETLLVVIKDGEDTSHEALARGD
jgi:hypothetical protein